MTTLPTSRALLTSIINTLTTPPPAPTHQQTDTPYYPPSNPLKSLPSSHRALLTTLHVLFPPPMLLQALDLLDRNLVTCLILTPTHPQKETESITHVCPPQAHIHLPPSEPEPELNTEDSKKTPPENKMYLVRSSQPTRGRYASGTGGTVYTVHLGGWNCSCAAFAFAAFPASGFVNVPWSLDGDEDEGVNVGVDDGKGQKEWEFGGLSLDGVGSRGGEGGVPVCKHLLACLLGERWNGVLGSYVKKRMVSRDEMAGNAAEG